MFDVFLPVKFITGIHKRWLYIFAR